MVDRSIEAILQRVKRGQTDATDADILWNRLFPDERARMVESFICLRDYVVDCRELITQEEREALAKELV